ncbi:MAG: hypothetical protein ACLQU2_36780 [Candidatus Binataceae bacterium]
MIGRARWILIGTAVMLVAGALSWSCGGGGSTSCVVNSSGIPINVCGTPSTPGPSLMSIAICPGPPPTPTPFNSSTASPTAAPTEAICPSPVATVVPEGGTAVFHAVGIYNNASTQDLTNNASTTWITDNAAVAIPNSTPAGSYFAMGLGTATINAVSGGVLGSGAMLEVTPTTTPAITPTATPTPPSGAAFDAPSSDPSQDQQP